MNPYTYTVLHNDVLSKRRVSVNANMFFSITYGLILIPYCPTNRPVISFQWHTWHTIEYPGYFKILLVPPHLTHFFP